MKKRILLMALTGLMFLGCSWPYSGTGTLANVKRFSYDRDVFLSENKALAIIGIENNVPDTSGFALTIQWLRENTREKFIMEFPYQNKTYLVKMMSPGKYTMKSLRFDWGSSYMNIGDDHYDAEFELAPGDFVYLGHLKFDKTNKPKKKSFWSPEDHSIILAITHDFSKGAAEEAINIYEKELGKKIENKTINWKDNRMEKLMKFIEKQIILKENKEDKK